MENVVSLDPNMTCFIQCAKSRKKKNYKIVWCVECFFSSYPNNPGSLEKNYLDHLKLVDATHDPLILTL